MAEVGAFAVLKMDCQPLKLCLNLPSHRPLQTGASSPPPLATPSPLLPQLSPGQNLKARGPAAPSAASCTSLFTREGVGLDIMRQWPDASPAWSPEPAGQESRGHCPRRCPGVELREPGGRREESLEEGRQGLEEAPPRGSTM